MAENILEDRRCIYNFLGRSGVKVSNICLGTMTFGAGRGFPTQSDEALAHEILDRFARWGGNFIDTANVYSDGVSEQILGSWLKKQDREDFIIATKLRGVMSQTNPNKTGLSRVHMMEAIDASLKRLQTEYIDLYQMHIWDSGVPVKETLMAFDDLIRSGKVRYVGASNVTGWQLQKIVDLGEKMELSPFITLQQQYSLLSRESEFEVFDVCKNEGIGVLPFSPLKGGLLTGKYKRDVSPDQKTTRIGHAHNLGMDTNAFPSWTKTKQNDSVWKIVAQTEDIAKKRGKTMPQVALRWLLQKPIVPSVIIGATSIKQLDDNMGAANGWELTEEEMETLDQVSAPDVPYPYKTVKSVNASRVNPYI